MLTVDRIVDTEGTVLTAEELLKSLVRELPSADTVHQRSFLATLLLNVRSLDRQVKTTIAALEKAVPGV